MPLPDGAPMPVSVMPPGVPSGSMSFDRGLIVVLVPTIKLARSSVACGAMRTGSATDTVTMALAVRLVPSEMVYEKVTMPAVERPGVYTRRLPDRSTEPDGGWV